MFRKTRFSGCRRQPTSCSKRPTLTQNNLPVHPHDTKTPSENSDGVLVSRSGIGVRRISGGRPSAARRRRCASAPFQPSLRLRSTVSAHRPQTDAGLSFILLRSYLHHKTERASCLHYMARSRRQGRTLPPRVSTLTAFASPWDGT